MNREEAMKKSDDALKELAESLKQGKSDALLRYLTMLSRFHRYSFGNCMLIALQKPEASLVAGFHRWKELHRWVKKDEKGIAILAPMIGRRKKDADSGSGKESQGTDDTNDSQGRVVRGFRVAYVFDVEQTEGKELTEFASLNGDPGEHIAKLEQIIVGRGIELEYVDSLMQGANGASFGGKVQVRSSLPAPQKFSTLVHELAHELLHRGDRRTSTPTTVRETEAESVAYVVCRSIGLECSTKASDYIQIWDGDEKVLMQSLELIRNVATSILTELEAKPDEQPEDSAATAASVAMSHDVAQEVAHVA